MNKAEKKFRLNSKKVLTNPHMGYIIKVQKEERT